MSACHAASTAWGSVVVTSVGLVVFLAVVAVILHFMLRLAQFLYGTPVDRVPLRRVKPRDDHTNGD